MASTLKDSLSHWRKKLERTNDEDTILNTIHKLSKVPITVDLLQDTGIGKIVRSLAKKSGKVGLKASSVLQNWREVVAATPKMTESSSKLPKHSSQKRENSNGEKSSNDKSHKQLIHEKHRKPKHSHDSSHKQKHESDSSKHSSSKKKSSISSDYVNEEKCENTFDFNTANDCVNVESRVFTSECSQKRNTDQVFQNGVPDSKKRKKDYPQSCDISDEKKHKEFSSVSNGLSNKKKNKKEFTSSLNGVSEDGKYKHELDLHVNGEPDQRKHKYNVAQTSDSYASYKSEAVQNLDYDSSKKKGKEKKSHKSSDHKGTEKSHSRKNKEPKKKTSSKLNACLNIEPTEAFTSSEVRFEDCLSFNDIVPVRRKKSSKSTSEKKGKHALNKEIGNGVAVASKDKNIAVDKNGIHLPPDLFEPQPSCSNGVDIVSTLPRTQPNYRPLPQRNYDDGGLSKKKVLSNEEAIKFTSSRREKTSVYSGRRNLFYTEVPSLVDCCVRVLIENLDSIEYIGGAVPYFIMKHVLKRCSAPQLLNIEDFNPYLLDETQELWEIHCKKDFRTHKRQENETWRDLYWRATEERERKLRSITANISASMTNSTPGRRVQLAYVDSVVKPPRDVARKQAKHGTALPVKHPVKAGPPSKATPRPVAPAINSAASHSREIVPKKPKVAPLMAKTLKSMRQCYRR